jgi:acylphosphatase
MEIRYVKAVVSGRVQGVWFRAWTKDTAKELGLLGQVRNLADGRVEAIFEGEEAAVKVMIDRLHEGSPKSQVSGVEIEEIGDSSGFTQFEIVR